MPKVIGYFRVSTDRQADQGSSLETQEAKVRAMATVQGATLLEVIGDGGASGKSLNRPGLQRLLSLVNSGDVKSVIIPKLDRLTRSVKAGAVLLIVRNGKIATFDAIGYQVRATQTPMKKDSIFRIASMSKPITTVAAMILAEENKLDVGAPVALYLPEFRDVKVGAEGAALKRPMTIQDLMRHTSGLTYGLFGNSPVDQMYRKANIFASKSLEEMVKTIATMPLLHQPGETWEYSVSTDVLGRVVEVASGMDFDRFIEERITGPLKMNDTGFWVKPESVSRLAKPDAQSGLPFPDATQKPAILSGGGGLFSTAGDYARFCQMLLNGGELEGVRILAPKTIALMTSDQLPATTERHTPVALALGAFGPLPEMGTSFGLGFAVRVDAGRNPVPGSVGDFSWEGITGTLFCRPKGEVGGCSDGPVAARPEHGDLAPDSNNGLSGDDPLSTNTFRL